MKKIRIFQITILLLFIVFLLFLFRDVNYKEEYDIFDIHITEEYNKDKKAYYFTLTYNNITFDYLYESDYKPKRKLINKVEIVKDESDFCLIPSKELDIIPLCYQDEKIIYYKKVKPSLLSKIPDEYLKEEKELKDTYQEINIYNRDFTYLIWNYNGFYFINQDTQKEIKLFDKEEYNAPLVGYTKDYLLIANYDSEYTYDKIIRLSLKDGAVKDLALDFEIYFNSYFIGYVKNKLYIIDNNEEVMIELNAKNGSSEKIKPRIYNRGTWEDVNIKSLINQNKQFTAKTNFNYELNNHILTLNYTDKKITTQIDEEVTKIIRVKDNLVFYLKKDTLYSFSPQTGSTKLLKYFEWNFNNTNTIYVD